MNKKGTRATNGEGYIGTTIQKIKKKFDNTNICKICANCNDRSLCDNRQGYKKCDKCKNCKEECFNYCDRFYIRKMTIAQITVDGKQHTVATKTTRKETVAEKKKKETDAENGTFVKKSNKTLYHFCKSIENEKLKANIIEECTVNRNKDTFKKLQNASFYEKPIQKTSKKEIDEFINSYRYLSQSELDKLVRVIQSGYTKAMYEDVITYKQNFMKDYKAPFSLKQSKEVVAFELEEFLTLLEYLLTTDNLVINSKCKYDSRSIRNMFILSFLSLTRIGELCALDINKHIDLDKKHITVERTLTTNMNGKVKMGSTTKTGKRQKKTRRRTINFNLFSEELYELVLQDQIKHAKSIKNNTENLLFCDKNGNYVSDNSITDIFKRICRAAEIKLELPTGCFIHMTRHTGISFMLCMGFELIFITIFSGHSSTVEIERTYGHILSDYKKKKLENPNFQYTKEDIIPNRILELARKRYKNS